MKAPEYTFKDLIYYAGLFLGIIGTYLILQSMGINPIVRLIVGLVVGVGIGWGLERLYLSIDPKDRDPDQP